LNELSETHYKKPVLSFHIRKQSTRTFITLFGTIYFFFQELKTILITPRRVMAFPTLKQLNKFDCGLTCIQLILRTLKIDVSIHLLKKLLPNKNNGVSLLDLDMMATEIGFKTKGISLDLQSLSKLSLPCIVHWQQQHFVVVYQITKKTVRISDPGPGLLIDYSIPEFLAGWLSKQESNELGYALLLDPTKQLQTLRKNERKKKWAFIKALYLVPFKIYYILIFTGMLLGLFLSFLTPFIAKSIVDIGINEKDLSFINLMLVAQLTTAASATILNVLRSWIFLHMGWRMNFNAVSNFLVKILKLPVSFFDTSQVGDLLQRINDHGTLKMFVSASTFSVIFSFFNLIMFGGILAYYNLTIFGIFLVSSIAYVAWVRLFMQKRKAFDYKLFDKNATNQNKLLQIFSGIKDIKLNNYERHARKQWEDVQAETFQVNAQQMAINQYQQIGSFLIEISKTIFITYFTAKLVIKGEMTIGMMLSVQYILGQLNVPVAQFISFNNSLQDAKISIDRINEVYERADETSNSETNQPFSAGNITFSNVNFKYAPSDKKATLHDISLTIPLGKTTALVGVSGSGKSTILRMLLKFYQPNSGVITVNGCPLNDIAISEWRSSCASVLQDGFIFTDTFLHNIAFGAVEIDYEQAEQAAKLANIHQHIIGTADGYYTVVGTEVNSLSQGQRQRLLIARAIYKNADYLFLDEPTTALDIRNEKLITANILRHFQHKTIVVVAHRLSTIANADQIIVIDQGVIVEQGTHQQLMENAKLYKQMVIDYNEN